MLPTKMANVTLKDTFEVVTKHGAFYTGGNIQWSSDGEYIFCQKHGTVSILSMKKGTAILELGESSNNEDEDVMNTFVATSDDVNIITHHKSGLFKLWSWRDNKLITVWKSVHKGPVARIAHSVERNLMVSGGSDSSVRVWDLQRRACTQNLRGAQGVVSVLAFHPTAEKELVFAAADDFKIYGWNILTGKQQVVLSGHFSKVTSLSFHENGDYLVSSGRDRVLILWSIRSGSSMRVVPVYEEVEDAFIVPANESLPSRFRDNNEDSVYVASAGEKGIVKIWETRTGKEIYAQENSTASAAKEEDDEEEKEANSITRLLYNSNDNTFAAITADHNIMIHSLETFECIKQVAGYSDEILDIVYVGTGESHVAIATNSRDIKVYDAATMNCQLLRGHTDIVLCLATTPANAQALLSSAKDNSVRVWIMDKETAKVSCVASATRHTASVGCVAAFRTSLKFFASVSHDSCLKLWNLSQDVGENGDIYHLDVESTVMAHEKDINSVAVSPNDKLIATGSQDKTAKLWSATDLQLLGVFRGHRRGVWCVRFSPIDQVLLTTSADCTIKIWSLSELQCLKTMEGHESSVLKAEFLSRGMQVMTTSGDGLLKVWNIKTSECSCTLEQHTSRVWALAVSKDEKTVVSGGSDSLLVFWKDATEEKKAKAATEAKRLALEEQQLSNLLKANELSCALKLSLKLRRPLQVLKITECILKKSVDELAQVLDELKPEYKEELLNCAIAWNTNSKNCHVAQVVINALTTEMESGAFEGRSSSVLESVVPYTQRHYTRITKLLQNLHLFSYTLNRMKPHVPSVQAK